VSPAATTAEIGVFGGSGFYSFLDDAVDVEVDTPYGPPAAPIRIGEVAGRRVAFLPRHGRRHELLPHRINYRANLWAMREVGVTRIIGPCAAGSLQPEVAPGDFVIPDQLVDRTWGRADTFYEGPVAHHVSYADPYCSGSRAGHPGRGLRLLQVEPRPGPPPPVRRDRRGSREAGLPMRRSCRAAVVILRT
jgi:5'-methylthioadenosine phosphorylase